MKALVKNSLYKSQTDEYYACNPPVVATVYPSVVIVGMTSLFHFIKALINMEIIIVKQLFVDKNLSVSIILFF